MKYVVVLSLGFAVGWFGYPMWQDSALHASLVKAVSSMGAASHR